MKVNKMSVFVLHFEMVEVNLCRGVKYKTSTVA